MDGERKRVFLSHRFVYERLVEAAAAAEDDGALLALASREAASFQEHLEKDRAAFGISEEKRKEWGQATLPPVGFVLERTRPQF